MLRVKMTAFNAPGDNQAASITTFQYGSYHVRSLYSVTVFGDVDSTWYMTKLKNIQWKFFDKNKNLIDENALGMVINKRLAAMYLAKHLNLMCSAVANVQRFIMLDNHHI